MSEAEADRAFEEWDARLEREYWNESIMDGAIPICHLGCAYRQWLVVTGKEAGNVWCDDRVDNRGIHPLLFQENRRVSFAVWYNSWLDQSHGAPLQPDKGHNPRMQTTGFARA
jgi:hypothetical protein